jgi:hypothetical protein
MIFNCSGKTVYQAPVFPNEDEIHFEIINDSFLTMGVFYMDICDSLLVMCSPMMTPIVNIFNKETGVLIKSVGTIGQGPEELVNPSTCSFDHKNKILYILDDGKRSVFGFNIPNIIHNTRPFLEQKRLWEQESIIISIHHLKDSLFIAHGQPEGLIVSTIHENSYRKTLEYESHPDIKPFEWFHIMHDLAINTVSPDGSKYILATILGGILDIHSINSEEIKLTTRKNFYKPVYDIQGGTIMFIDETIFGFYSLSSTEDFLYVAVYGKVNPTEQPKTIWKFDWDGNPVTTYNCNYSIEGFVVDEQAEQIYAFVYNTDGELTLAKGKLGNRR